MVALVASAHSASVATLPLGVAHVTTPCANAPVSVTTDTRSGASSTQHAGEVAEKSVSCLIQ
jgi:hypothetical protein